MHFCLLVDLPVSLPSSLPPFNKISAAVLVTFDTKSPPFRTPKFIS